jgi:hypothetical protein
VNVPFDLNTLLAIVSIPCGSADVAVRLQDTAVCLRLSQQQQQQYDCNRTNSSMVAALL